MSATIPASRALTLSTLFYPGIYLNLALKIISDIMINN